MVWLGAVVLLVVGAVAVGVASATTQEQSTQGAGTGATQGCSASLSSSPRSGVNLKNGKLIEGRTVGVNFWATACDLTEAQQGLTVSVASQDSTAITATVSSQSSSTSGDTTNISGIVNMTAVQDTDDDDESVQVTVSLGSGDDAIELGYIPIQTSDDD